MNAPLRRTEVVLPHNIEAEQALLGVDRIERELVSRHAAIGTKAEHYPLSGGSRFRGSGHDVDIYAFGKDEAPLVAEVKSRPWRVWAALLARVRR